MAKNPSVRPPKAKRVNMRTIAKEAGVSATTVSLALRNDPSISPATRERIREIQAAMGYQPVSRRARNHGSHGDVLSHLTYHVIGVDMREENYAPFLHGVTDEARRLEIKVELQCTLDRAAAAQRIHDQVPSPDHGLILTGALDDRHVAAARASGVPFLVLGNYRFASPTHAVGVDLMDVARRLLGDLAEEGMKSLAVVVEDFSAGFERSCLMYLRGAFCDLGFGKEDELLVETGASFARAAEAAETIVAARRPGLYVLTLENHCAQHLILELTARQAPGDAIPLVSLGDVSTLSRARHFRVFDVGKEACAHLAVIRLAELLRDPETPPCTSLVTCPGWS